MASVQQGGVGVVFGLTGAHQVAGVVTVAALSKFNDSANFTNEWNHELIYDEDGVPRVGLNHGNVWHVEFEFTPKASSKANAAAELRALPPGCTLVVTAMPMSALNTTWAIIGSSVRFQKAGVTTYTIRAEYSPEADITTTVS